MASSDPQLRYATHTELADGVKTDFEVNFVGGYINPAHVLCVSVLVDEETGLATDRQIHTTEIVSASGNAATVRVAPAVADGRTVIIFRDTTKTAMLVQYVNGSLLSKANLDLANEQLLMLIQEMLDGLNENSLTVNDAVQTVIDLNELIRNIYESVLELLASGGIVSVTPRVFSGVGNGEDTDFPMVGADVDGAGFYDTYLDGFGLEPDLDYAVLMGDTPADTVIRFTVPPGDGARWFTVLRGYAKPYTGASPITSLRTKIIDVGTTQYFVGIESEFALLRATNETSSTFFVKEIPEAGDPLAKMYTGSYFSIVQRGSAQAVVEPDSDNVELIVPAGYLPRTRALNSVISLTCEYGDGNQWIVSGDLAKE